VTLDEVADRDIVLAEPFTVQRAGKTIDAHFSWIVISVRDIKHMYVDYLPSAMRKSL
jgi:hypothetical protein